MRKFYSIGLFLILVLTSQTKAQNSFSFSCAKDTTINGCALSCITLISRIPDIRSSTSDYVINPISGSGGCFAPYVDANTPGNPTSLVIDDRYSTTIALPFAFPFYDDAASPYSSLLASTNGFLSFDVSKATQFSHWSMTPGNVPNTGYDRSLVMGVFHDLDPSVNTSPTQRIKYDVIGIAPHRKFILSFYKVPLFSTACNSLIENTHQIVLYESLGVIEVFVNSVQPCAGWNSGKKMIGLQNFNRNKGIMAPGRTANGGAWGSVNMNESWRFVPAVGPTRYRGVELYDLAGNLISTGDTTSIGNNTFEVAFPNVCPTGTTTYVIKSKYEQFNNPGNFVFGTDTVTVIAANPLSATSATTPATCASLGIGSVTLSVTGGPGPFEYSSDNGVTWQSSNVFNLPPGTYTILYREVGSTCNATTTITIAADPNLVTGAYAVSNLTCNGNGTGSIVITATNGTGTYEYSIDGGTTYQPGNTFSNLAAGSYNIRIRDNAGCFRDTVINVIEPAVLASAVSNNTNATCSATPNGSITVTTTGGTTNYEYSLDGGAYGASNTFAVFDGAHTIDVRDANGCTTSVNVTTGLTNDLVVDTRVDTTLCFGASLVLNTTGNAATYTWSGNGTGLNDNSIASPTATPTTLGLNTYIVTAVLGQCTKTDQVVLDVQSQVSVNAGADVSVIAGDQAQLNATVTGATNFLWTSIPNDPNFNATILNPVVKPTETTIYKLTATNAIGCTASDDVTVTIIPYCILVNNAFSPNGDGINDLWSVYRQYDCLKNIKLTVFNRYGSKVFESKDYRNNWDGRYSGKPVPDGTYYAVIEFTLVSGKTFTTKTDLTIIR
jgi:gliding motility-associated-like protein